MPVIPLWWESRAVTHQDVTVGRMKAPAGSSYRLPLDAKRRPTLPAALLAEAGIDATHELVARADGPGRLVLEDPLSVLAAFQGRVVEGKQARGFEGLLADDLLADREADAGG